MQSNLESTVRELCDRVEGLENSMYNMQKLLGNNLLNGFVKYELNINETMSDSVDLRLGTLTLVDSEVELLLVYQAVSNVTIDALLFAGVRAVGCGKLVASPISSVNFVYAKVTDEGVLNLSFSQTGLVGSVSDFRLFVRGKADFIAK